MPEIHVSYADHHTSPEAKMPPDMSRVGHDLGGEAMSETVVFDGVLVGQADEARRQEEFLRAIETQDKISAGQITPEQELYEQFDRLEEKLTRLGYEDVQSARESATDPNSPLKLEARFALLKLVSDYEAASSALRLHYAEKDIKSLEVQNRDLEEQLETMGVDSLTGAMTKDRFDKHLKAEYGISFLEEDYNPEHPERGIYKKPRNFGILFLDLSGFKGINDNFGHDVGDQVLNQIACIANDAKRASDILARIGGDEFMVLLPMPDDMRPEEVDEKTHERAEDFRAVLSRPRTEDPAKSIKNGRPIQPVVSIGSAGGRVASSVARQQMTDKEIEELSTFKELNQRADASMYEAKKRLKANDPTIEKYSRTSDNTEADPSSHSSIRTRAERLSRRVRMRPLRFLDQIVRSTGKRPLQ